MGQGRWLRKWYGVVALLLLSGMASGSSFTYPPETYAPEWHTSFPYQRNIDWTFDTNPEGGPSSEGAPGADYEGYLDPVLKSSDYVTFTGSAGWLSTLDDSPWYTATGVIGIDNRTGNEEASGNAVFHIDNVDTPWIKHVWMEFELGSGGGSTSLQFISTLPPGSVMTDVDLSLDGWIWWEFDPNPIWEELTLRFRVEAGAYLVLDRVHVATECGGVEVPEPVTLALLAAGAAAAGLARRRR